jgi:hypothetical protein
LQDHEVDQPKHLRKMVESHYCRIIVVCVIKASIHENLLTHEVDQPKHKRKMVEGHYCRIIVVCVIKASIHENLLTTFLY